MGKASRGKRDRRIADLPVDRRALVQRLRSYEARIEAGIPGWVAVVDRLRNVAAQQQEPWPDWCLVPLMVPYAAALHFNLLRRDGRKADGTADVAGLQWPGTLGAMYAWSQGRGIYRYDPELAVAVVASDLPTNIGTDMLFHLPEWGLLRRRHRLELAATICRTADGDRSLVRASRQSIVAHPAIEQRIAI
jgi:hypothetical protein